jgi:hypothetical protein
LIGTVFGTSATNAFADDPFKNKVNIETDIDKQIPVMKPDLEIIILSVRSMIT